MTFNKRFSIQEKKLAHLAKLAQRFSRAADALVDAAVERGRYDGGSRGAARAQTAFEKRSVAYDAAQKALLAFSEEMK